MSQTAEDLLASLAQEHLTIAVAESLTGGMISAELTSVPGASKVVRGAVVSYATETKSTVLGVNLHTIEELGVVSAEVALQMAVGVKDLLSSDIALGATGVAGPDSQDGVTVGTVFIACVSPTESVVEEFHLQGNRAEIRRQSVKFALEMAQKMISSSTGE